MLWVLLFACGEKPELPGPHRSSEDPKPETQSDSEETSQDQEKIDEPRVDSPAQVGGAFLTCIVPESQEGLASNEGYCGLSGENSHPVAIDIARDQWQFTNAKTKEQVESQLILGNKFQWKIASDDLEFIILDFNRDNERFTFTSELQRQKDLPSPPEQTNRYFYWAPGEPSGHFKDLREDCATVDNRDGDEQKKGGWNDESCSRSFKAACRSDSDPKQWTLSKEKGEFADAVNDSKACPSGYSFSVPNDADDNAALLLVVRELAPDKQVWINLTDRRSEGTWEEEAPFPSSKKKGP